MGRAGDKPIGAYLPGTTAGEEALQDWVNLYLEGEREGGAMGLYKQASGAVYGSLAALWTPETSTSTALTLGTAGIGTSANAARLAISGLTVKGVAKTTAIVASGGVIGGGINTSFAPDGEKSVAFQSGFVGGAAATGAFLALKPEVAQITLTSTMKLSGAGIVSSAGGEVIEQQTEHILKGEDLSIDPVKLRITALGGAILGPLGEAAGITSKSMQRAAKTYATRLARTTSSSLMEEARALFDAGELAAADRTVTVASDVYSKIMGGYAIGQKNASIPLAVLENSAASLSLGTDAWLEWLKSQSQTSKLNVEQPTQ